DIRNPLGAIKTAAQFLPSRPPDDRAITTELTHSILAGVSQIESIVTDLLDYGRGTTLDRQEYRLGVVGGPAVEASAEKAGAGGVALVTRGLDADVVVVVDGQRLRRVFVNVISNALEAVGQRPAARVEVEVYPREMDAVVQITDNGEGIAPEVRA